MSWAKVKKINSDMSTSLDKLYKNSFQLAPLPVPIRSNISTRQNYTMKQSGTILVRVIVNTSANIDTPGGFVILKNGTQVNLIQLSSMSQYVEKECTCAVQVESGDKIIVNDNIDSSYRKYLTLQVDLCGMMIPCISGTDIIE